MTSVCVHCRTPYRVDWWRCEVCGGQGTVVATAPDLFDPTPPDNGTATSRAAAGRIAPVAATMRQVVYEAITRAPDGLTRAEIVRETGLAENSVNPRSAELLRAGLVIESGQRDGRKVLISTEGPEAA